MRFTKSRIVFFLFVLISFIVLLVLYSGIFHIFYEQDEWVIAGFYLANGFLGPFVHVPWYLVIAGYGRPLSSPINYVLFSQIHFATWPLALFSLGIHYVNAVLVYLCIRKLAKNDVIAFISGVFFIIAQSSAQAITWFGASTTTLPSVTFLLLSYLALFAYIDSKKRKILYLSQGLCIISYLFKESTVIFFATLPILVFYLRKERFSFRFLWIRFWPILLYFGYVVGIRFSFLLTPSAKVGVFVTTGGSLPLKLLFHGVLYPVISLIQYYVPPLILYKLASLIQSIQYDFLARYPLSQAIAQNIVTDSVSIVGSFLLFLLALFVIGVNTYRRQTILLSLLFVLISIIPYIVLDRGASYFDSRYYYTGLIGASGLFASVVYQLIHKARRNALLFVLTILLGGLFLGGYLYKEIVVVRRDVGDIANESVERVAILQKMKKLYPVLPEKPIVYITGSKTDYYGIPHHALPFQQGVGNTLMVWYYKTGVIPKLFLTNWFLTDLKSQGYEEENGKGFGYFSDMNELINALKTHPNIHTEQIIGFYYNANTKILSDITQEVRKSIQSKTYDYIQK